MESKKQYVLWICDKCSDEYKCLNYRGGTAMLNMLKKNNSIASLRISANQIPQETVDAIGKIWEFLSKI